MVIGMLRVQLHINGARGLQDRQRVVRRAIDRIRSHYNASISDVGDTEHAQVATLAVAIVCRSQAECDHNLAKIEAAIEDIMLGHAIVTPAERDITHFNADTPLAAEDYTPMAKGAFPSPDPRSLLRRKRPR